MKTKLHLPDATGLFETHLSVSDLDRSTEFYGEGAGLPLALEQRERGATFFWIGRPGPGDARPVVPGIGTHGVVLSAHVLGLLRR